MGLSLGSSFDDPHTQGILALGLGLLGSRGSFAQSLSQAGAGAMGVYQQQKDAQARRKTEDMQRQMAEMQLQQAKEAQQRDQLIRDAQARRVLSSGQNAMGQVAEMGGQRGPSQEAAALAQKTSPGFDMQGFANDLWGIDYKQALALQGAMKKEKPKLKDTQIMRDPGTGKLINVMQFEDGTTKILPYGVRPDIALQSLGNRTVAIDKNMATGGQSWAQGESPDAVLRSKTDIKIANQKDGTERFLAGTRYTPHQNADGTTTMLPTQIIPGKDGSLPPVINGLPVKGDTKLQASAKEAVPLINEAKRVIEAGSTGSWLGAGVDFVGDVFGASTGGAEGIAKLKVLGGKLMMAQPRMEGPQSNADASLYSAMAGNLGDPTVPNGRKLAAIETMLEITDRWNPDGTPKKGMWSADGKPLNEKPKAAQPTQMRQNLEPWAPMNIGGSGGVYYFDANGQMVQGK